MTTRSARRFAPRLGEKGGGVGIVAVLLISALATGGCQSVGPGTVEGDRLDYSTAITESWKQQTLLNVVKLRYADPPVFVDIGQIVAGYTLETSGNVGVADQNSALGGTSVSLGGSAKFTDRPTITYVPLTGNSFVNSLITPIAPISLFSAIQAGWPADNILRLAVSRINGISNEQFSGAGLVPAEPEFSRLIEIIRQLQASGSLSIRVERAATGTAATLFVLPGRDRSPATAELSRELRELLQLDPDRSDFALVYGLSSSSGGEIAVQSRSLLNILQLVSSQAEIPEEHVREGRASPTPDNTNRVSLPGFRILSSKDKPVSPYVVQRYRDAWFYIDDTDFRSKQIFALIMLLFTLSDSSPDRAAPVITIPVG